MIGFDSETALVNGLKDGLIDSLVVQNPLKMGYEGVRSVVLSRQGKELPRRQDTGVQLITKDSLSNPEIAALVGE